MTEVKENKFAIHEAAREGRLQVVENLLSNNPKLSTVLDPDDRLPIHWACSYNHLPIVRLLVSQRNFDPDIQDGSGWTSLMIASSLKEDAGLEIIELLLNKEAEVKTASNTGGTALHFAVSKGNLEVVKRLMDAGATARVKDKRGQLPLHRVAAVGNVPILKLLLGPKGRSPVNATDVDGMTALHHAVSEGHGHVAVELLKAGAEADKKDVNEKTALDLAPDGKVRSYILQAMEREGITMET